MAGNKRATDAEKNLRVFEVSKAILKGYSKRAYLFQYISENYEWDVSERQLENYLKEAREIIKNRFNEEDIEIEKDIALSRLEALFVMNMKIQDYRECRNVTIDRMKLMGIYVDKKENTIKGLDLGKAYESEYEE